MKARLTIMICVVLGASSYGQSIDFDLYDPQSELKGALMGDMEMADVDDDGDLDLFICGRENGWVSLRHSTLYINNGEGNFTADESNDFIGLEAASAGFNDLDDDGDPDLVLIGLQQSMNAFAGIYLNDGDGNFTLMTESNLEPTSDGDFAFGDVDGDEDADLCIMGVDSEGVIHVTLYLNGGSADFTAVDATPFESISYGSIAFADLNNDEKLDLLMMGMDDGELPKTATYLNDGSGNFSVWSSGIVDFKAGDFAVGDLDGDGDNDVLISGQDADDVISTAYYLNDGSGVFSLCLTDTPFPALFVGEQSFWDLDGDEDLDVFMTGSGDGGLGSETGIISIVYENLGSNNFMQSDSLIGSYISSHVIGDIDGDEKLDIIISGTTVGNPTFTTWSYQNLTETSVGILESNVTGELTIYPNPSSGEIFISTDKSGRTLEIYNSLGALVYREYLFSGFNQVQLLLPVGLYTVVLSNEQSSKISRLSIAR